VSPENSIKKFCGTKHFLAGAGIGLALLALILPIIMPFINSPNNYAIYY